MRNCSQWLFIRYVRSFGELDLARVNAVLDGRMPVAETVEARVDLVDGEPVATRNLV